MSVSRVNEGLDLHLRILDRSRFTTTISLSHGFEGGGLEASPMPAVCIRIYHDARLAEALTTGHVHASPTDTLAQRWESNRFLQHWLLHCLNRKHRFCSTARADHLDNGLAV